MATGNYTYHHKLRTDRDLCDPPHNGCLWEFRWSQRMRRFVAIGMGYPYDQKKGGASTLALVTIDPYDTFPGPLGETFMRTTLLFTFLTPLEYSLSEGSGALDDNTATVRFQPPLF